MPTLTHEQGIDLGQQTCLQFQGPDVLQYLQGLVTQDVRQLKADQCLATCVLNPRGGLIAYGFMWQNADCIFLHVQAVDTAAVKSHFDRYHIADRLDITITQPKRLVHFPYLETCEDRSDSAIGCHRYGIPGLDVWMDEPFDFIPIDTDQLEVSRIKRGVPVFGQDMFPDDNPLIYGLADAISKHKGCYIGQETVAMTRDRGRPPRRLVVCRSQGVQAVKGPVRYDKDTVGDLSSVAMDGEIAHGLATVKYSVAQRENILVDALNQSWTIIQVADYGKPS